MGISALRFGKAALLNLAAAALAGLLLGASPPPEAQAIPRTLPQGFAGVTMDPWQLSREGIDPETELARAAASGVESIRFPVYWSGLQLAEGAPYRWSELDAFVEAAARLRLTLLPTLLGAPRWAADPRYLGKPTDPVLHVPASNSAFAGFASSVVARYQPSSPFWTTGRDAPLKPVRIKAWQVWNEPDISLYWPQHIGECQSGQVSGQCSSSTDLRFAPTYLALLKPTARAIRAADPTAKIMLASLTNLSWASLGRLYSAGGRRLAGRGLFDLVATNTFTANPSNLLKASAGVRRILSSHGDGLVPLVISEYSWTATSAVSLLDTKMVAYLSVSPSEQARRLGAAFDLITRNRRAHRIAGAYWYTWASSYRGVDSIWSYAGLRSWATGIPSDTAALSAYRSRALRASGCKAKLLADTCSR